MSLIDTGYISRLGVASLAAVGPATSLFHFSNAVPRALSLSTVTLVASSIAKAKYSNSTENNDSGDIAYVSLTLAAIFGTLITLILTQFGSKCLTLMSVATGIVVHPL